MPKNLVNGKQSDWCSQRCGQEAINSGAIPFLIFLFFISHSDHAAPIILPIGEKYTAFENGTLHRLHYARNHDLPYISI